jgi:alkaline phosphatase
MKKLTSLFLILSLLFIQLVFIQVLQAQPCPPSFSSINAAEFLSPNLKRPVKNLVLVLGDGFGPLHLKAMLQETGKKDTVFASLPHRGEMTHCSLSGVTDSAASATAMATGFKTLNAVISVSAKEKPLKTILEMAQDLGKKTGLVTNTEITHATPACFAAHQPQRKMATAIASDYLNKSKPDLLVGGGRRYFQTLGLNKKGRKKPYAWQGYQVVGSMKSFERAARLPQNKILALFAENHMDYERDRRWVAKRKRQPALHELTKVSLKFLSQEDKGFFLMVEGGRIDHASHANDLERMVGEVEEFSRTVSLIFSWARENPETLVLVTADHETGGLVFGDTGFAFTTNQHTAAAVTLWGYGPNSDVIKKTQDNRAVFHILANALAGPTPNSSTWVTHDRL